MTEQVTEQQLGVLVEVLKKCERQGDITSDGTITLKIIDLLSTEELSYLNRQPLAIRSASTSEGSIVKVSNLLDSATSVSSLSLVIEVPRIRRGLLVASNCDDFLEGDVALIHEPKEYLILSEELAAQPFVSSVESESYPEKIRSYRTVRRVIEILKTEADHASADGKTYSFFDAERIDIVIGACRQVWTSDFPADELDKFLSENGMQTLRKEAFKTTLWDTLKDYSTEERFRRLIEKGRGASFLRATKYNFRLAKSDHTLSKRLESARQEYRELAGSLAQLASGLEAKAFVLPGTLLFAGQFLSPGEGATFSNAVIILSTVALAIISTFAYRAHSDITRDFEDEIKKAKLNLLDTKEDKLIEKLDRLTGRFKRIRCLKRCIALGVCLVAIGIIVACFWSVDVSDASEEEAGKKPDSSIIASPPNQSAEPTKSSPKFAPASPDSPAEVPAENP